MTGFLEQMIHGAGRHAVAMLPGADVSSFQGPPKDWKQQAGRIEWGGVKTTEVSVSGSRLAAYLNPDAAADLAFLKSAGKGRVLYLFGHPDTPVMATFNLFASTAHDLGIEDGDGIAIDMEVTNGRTAAEVSQWTADLAGMLQREFDRAILIYTFRSFAEAGNCAQVSHCPLWLADPSAEAGHPRVPHPWSRWAIHQFDWTPLDRDVARFASLADFRTALGRRGTAPTMLEEPMLVLTGADADTPIALPDGAKKVRLAAVGETTVNVQFNGAKVQAGIRLDWTKGSHDLDVPAGCHLVRIYRPADGAPNVPVSVAVS